MKRILSQLHIARKLNVHRETVHLWIKAIERLGFLEFLDSYTNARKGEREKERLMDYLRLEFTG